jgi:HEPN domain-containing protein
MKEWNEELIKQSEYDLDTAKYMYEGGRYLYTIFMCHLCIEKSLKALYFFKTQKLPPKTHNLIFFIEELNLEIDNEIHKFIINLNQHSILTRYPEDFIKASKQFSKTITKNFIKETERTFAWIKQQF